MIRDGARGVEGEKGGCQWDGGSREEVRVRVVGSLRRASLGRLSEGKPRAGRPREPDQDSALVHNLPVSTQPHLELVLDLPRAPPGHSSSHLIYVCPYMIHTSLACPPAHILATSAI